MNETLEERRADLARRLHEHFTWALSSPEPSEDEMFARYEQMIRERQALGRLCGPDEEVAYLIPGDHGVVLETTVDEYGIFSKPTVVLITAEDGTVLKTTIGEYVRERLLFVEVE